MLHFGPADKELLTGKKCSGCSTFLIQNAEMIKKDFRKYAERIMFKDKQRLTAGHATKWNCINMFLNNLYLINNISNRTLKTSTINYIIHW